MASLTMFLLLAAVVVLAARSADAAQYISIVPNDPNYPEYCQESDTLIYHPNGSEWDVEDQCVRRACNFPYMYTFTCGAVAAEPPCELVEGDTTQAYPACCPQVRCPPVEFDNELGEDTSIIL